MSKSKGNVVNPDQLVESYGADTLRLYEMFMGPFDQAISWDTKSMVGPRRFIERIFALSEKVSDKATLGKEAEILLNKTIAKVSADIEAMGFNTAVSSLMILANALEKEAAIPQAAYESLLKLLAPFAPHVCEELWRGLGHKDSIHLSAWPAADASKLSSDESNIVVQVNGKVRASFKAAKNADKAALESIALSLPEVKKWIGEKTPEKVVVVPGKLVSVVVKG
jgi:leucyl-tRNA synthetase